MTPAADHEFAELLEQHRGILFKVANAYCREAADREDLAQEITLQLWRSFSRYDRQSRFSTWMYRIAMNVAISHYRARSARIGPTLPIEDAHHVATDDGPRDDVRILYDLIGELDELNRALTILFLDGHAYDEIGAILGLTPTNVATRVGRIKERLRTNYMERRR